MNYVNVNQKKRQTLKKVFAVCALGALAVVGTIYCGGHSADHYTGPDTLNLQTVTSDEKNRVGPFYMKHMATNQYWYPHPRDANGFVERDKVYNDASKKGVFYWEPLEGDMAGYGYIWN